MSTSQEAPALIQYACERCKTRFVLPPSSRKLSIAGRVRAFSMGVGRTFRHHEGLGAGYDSSRRQLLAKMDDEAYQAFVQSFRFCHECRQFVCNECWSTSRRSCLTCVAKSMTGTARPRAPFAPTGPEIPRPAIAAAPPRRGRLRRDLALVAVAIAIVLVSIEGGVLLVGATSGTPSVTANNVIAVVSPSASPSPSPTATPTAAPTDTPMPSFSDSPIPSDSPSPSPSLTVCSTSSDSPVQSPSPSGCPTASPTLAPAPKATPVPPLPNPSFSCGAFGGTDGAVSTCTTASTFSVHDKVTWFIDSSVAGSGIRTRTGKLQFTHDYGTPGYHYIEVYVTRSGTSPKSATGATP
jgi:hypothetical protein